MRISCQSRISSHPGGAIFILKKFHFKKVFILNFFTGYTLWVNTFSSSAWQAGGGFAGGTKFISSPSFCFFFFLHNQVARRAHIVLKREGK